MIIDLASIMTQARIAQEVGVSQPTVSRWINGRRNRIEFDVMERVIDTVRKHRRAITKAKHG